MRWLTRVCSSDRPSELGECYGEAERRRDIRSEFVVAAAKVLDDSLPGVKRPRCRVACYVPRLCGSASSRPPGSDVATVEDVRWLGSSLERSYQVYVRGRLKFRVKQIVYVAFSLDETEMGFAFPKEERADLVAAQPHRFHLPRPSDLRFNWVEADLAALEPAEAREFVVDAWRMVVPKKLARAYDLAHPDGPG